MKIRKIYNMNIIYKNLFILLALITIVSCEPHTIEVVKAAYPDGSTKMEYIMSVDEKIKYEQISYYDDGKINFRGKFKDDLKDGRWESFFMSGALKTVNNYEKNTYVGEYLQYHENGQISLKGQYKNGKPSGEWNYYNAEGEIVDTKNYDKNGKIK